MKINMTRLLLGILTVIGSVGFTIAVFNQHPSEIPQLAFNSTLASIIETFPTPTAEWRLEGQGNDTSGGNFLATNGVWFVPGRQALAGQFDGNSHYLSIPDNASLSTGNIDFTIAAWVKSFDFSGYRIIASKRDSETNTEWVLAYDAEHARFVFRTYSADGTQVGAVFANALSAPSINNWYLVVGWRDKTARKLNIQVNNGVVDSVSEIAPPGDTTSSFKIGYSFLPTTSWNGLIDEVYFWRQDLDQAERTQLYNNGNGWVFAPDTLITSDQPVVSATATPIVTASTVPHVTETPAATSTAHPTSSPTPSSIPHPTSTVTATPLPTSTPSPSTSNPTPTPTQGTPTNTPSPTGTQTPSSGSVTLSVLPGTGLIGTYFSNFNCVFRGINCNNFVSQHLDPEVNFSWGNGQPIGASYGFPKDNFSIRWDGYLRAPKTGSYTLYVGSDDGSMLFIDDSQKPFINNWGNHSYREKNATLTLKAGQFLPLHLYFYEKIGSAKVTLSWGFIGDTFADNIGKQIIPKQDLYVTLPAQSNNSGGSGDGSDVDAPARSDNGGGVNGTTFNPTTNSSIKSPSGPYCSPGYDLSFDKSGNPVCNPTTH